VAWHHALPDARWERRLQPARLTAQRAPRGPVVKDKPKRDRWDRAFDRKFAEDDGWSDAVSWKVA